MSATQITENTESGNYGGSEYEQMESDLRKLLGEESDEPDTKVRSETELNQTIKENITSPALSMPHNICVVIHRPIVVKEEPECATSAIDTVQVTQHNTAPMTTSQNGSTSVGAIAETVDAITKCASENEIRQVSTETSAASTRFEECVKLNEKRLTEFDVKTVAAESAQSDTERITTPPPPSISTAVEAESITEKAITEKVTTTVESPLGNETAQMTTESINGIAKDSAVGSTSSLGNGTRGTAEVPSAPTAGAVEPVRIKAEPLTEAAIAGIAAATSTSSNELDPRVSKTPTEATKTDAEQRVKASTSSLDNETEQATTSKHSLTTTVEAEPIRIKSEPLTETDAIAEKAAVNISLGNGSAHVAAETPIQAIDSVEEQSAKGSTSSLGNDFEQTARAPSLTTTVEKEPIRIKVEPLTEESISETITATTESSSSSKTANATSETPTQTNTGQEPTRIKAEIETGQVAQPGTSDESMDSTEDDENTQLPDDFFEDLLKSADEIKMAAMSPPPSTEVQDTPSGVNAAADTIPEHFFDDLLVDRVAERLANAVNEDLETKYSEKLKELKKLEREKHKKSKKAKKKSHKSTHSKNREIKKRSRSRSKSSERIRRKRRRPRSRSVEERIKVKSEFTSSYGSLNKVYSLFPHNLYNFEAEQQRKDPSSTIIVLDDSPPSATTRTATTSIRVKSEFSRFIPSAYEDQFQCLPVKSAVTSSTAAFSDAPTTSKRSVVENAGYTGFKRIKLEKVSREAAMADSLDDEPELVITPKMKRQKAILRAVASIKEIQHTEQSKEMLSNFIYTPVVRKLPASSSYVTQQIYENRSPLHTVNNVNFKFNSHATRFNMQEWGLEALPSWSTTIAKILCYDANTMAEKLKAIKIPTRLQKIKNENDEHGEEVDEVRSSFFTNAMTQTDDVTIIAMGGRNRNRHSIGLQVTPNLSSFATQTDAPLGTINSHSSSRNDDLPLMQLINVLNENQLLALNDFAELIREPATSAMDMYRLRQRMMDIYKSSQLASVLESLTSIPIPNSSALKSNHLPRVAYIYNTQRMADPRQRSTTHLRVAGPQQLSSDPRLAEHRQRPTSDPRLVDQRQRPTDPRNYATYTVSQQSKEPPPPPIYTPTPIAPPIPTTRTHSPELFNTSHGSSSEIKPKFFGRGALRR